MRIMLEGEPEELARAVAQLRPAPEAVTLIVKGHTRAAKSRPPTVVIAELLAVEAARDNLNSGIQEILRQLLRKVQAAAAKRGAK